MSKLTLSLSILLLSTTIFASGKDCASCDRKLEGFDSGAIKQIEDLSKSVHSDWLKFEVVQRSICKDLLKRTTPGSYLSSSLPRSYSHITKEEFNKIRCGKVTPLALISRYDWWSFGGAKALIADPRININELSTDKRSMKISSIGSTAIDEINLRIEKLNIKIKHSSDIREALIQGGGTVLGIRMNETALIMDTNALELHKKEVEYLRQHGGKTAKELIEEMKYTKN